MPTGDGQVAAVDRSRTSIGFGFDHKFEKFDGGDHNEILGGHVASHPNCVAFG